ncbi:MAG: phosphotransferase [Lachnospiraceae bacterium]|nr:phosphotransferase [Lachnospiraceae bacterium]
MLKLKYLFENFDLARECMELYECDTDSVDEMLRYFRISSNAIYPFRLKKEGRICFLRLSPVEEKTLADVESEIDLINWLIERDFPAMRPVPMKTGKLFGQIHTEWGTYNVSCFEKVAGNSLEDTKGTRQIVQGYGKTLGELHALMKEYPHSEERRNHKMFLCEIEERMKEYGTSEIVRREFGEVCKELEKLPMSASDYGVIHYDFEPDNVFYDDKEESFSVIDFDDAMCCWYALDVVRAIDALDEVIEDVNREEAILCFFEGYRSATTFTKEQLQSLPLMRRIVCLQEYATLLHVLSESVENMPEWMNNLSQKLKFKLHRLEESMDKGMTD